MIEPSPPPSPSPPIGLYGLGLAVLIIMVGAWIFGQVFGPSLFRLIAALRP